MYYANDIMQNIVSVEIDEYSYLSVRYFQISE